MTDVLERYEQQLIAAAYRLAAEGARSPAPVRRRRPSRVVAALAVGAVLAAGSAVAATLHPWSPSLGDPKYPDSKPAVSVNPPPPDQLATLGVLRRPAGAEDRDDATQASLRWMGYTDGVGTQGVRTEFIRRVGTTEDGQAITLVPAASYTREFGEPALADPVCLIATDVGDTGAATGCWTTADVEAGRAALSLGAHEYGIVPDGVARVTMSFVAGPDGTATVTDNVYDLRAPSDPRDPAPIGAKAVRVTWQAADGRVLRTIEP